MLRVRLIVAVIAFAVLSGPGFAAEKRGKAYIVCFGNARSDQMGSLLKSKDFEAADLYTRLFCWKIRPPARNPPRGADQKVIPVPPTEPLQIITWWAIEE